jgi:leader peptidase (prepilin peptidase)/N-methyltransferase
LVGIAALAGLLGLAIGSFLNVVAHRVPEGHSVVSPPSACPKCGTRIRNRDNVPVLGWILLRGRCRDCDEPISIRYPMVEAATGLAFFATTYVVDLTWSLPAYLWFVAVGIAFVLTDFDHHRLPNAIMLPGTVGGALLLLGGALGDARLPDYAESLASGAGYFALMFLLAIIANGGFGFGDVKLAFMLGMFAGYGGWPIAVLAALLGFLIGGFVSLFLVLTKLRGRKDFIPFGPPMILASWVAVAFGTGILDWYLG